MAKIRQDRLDEAVLNFLDGVDLDQKVGHALQLATAEADGTCHLALLSVGEVLAPDDGTVALALYNTSQTTANLRDRGRGLLFLVLDGVGIDIQLQVRSMSVERIRGKELALFVTEVTEVWRDEVGFARVTAGVSFELPRRAEVVERWQESVDLLRGMSCR